MKRSFGVIEILISFLLLSIIVAGFMHMALVQMKDGQMRHTKLEDAKNQAAEMINEIQDTRQRNHEYEEDLLMQGEDAEYYEQDENYSDEQINAIPNTVPQYLEYEEDLPDD